MNLVITGSPGVGKHTTAEVLMKGHLGYQLIDINKFAIEKGFAEKNEDGFSLKFEIDTFRKECLIKGLDDIDLTMAHSEKIDSFEKTLKFT